MFVKKSAKTSRLHKRTSRKGHAGCALEAPSPPSTTPTSTTAVRTAAAAATSSTASIVLLAIFGFGRVVHEKGIELKRIWENKVADVVAADGQGVQRDRFTVPHRHLDRF